VRGTFHPLKNVGLYGAICDCGDPRDLLDRCDRVLDITGNGDPRLRSNDKTAIFFISKIEPERCSAAARVDRDRRGVVDGASAAPHCHGVQCARIATMSPTTLAALCALPDYVL
jgi:hypothetical protein